MGVEYTVNDLFFTSWDQLRTRPRTLAEVYALQTSIAAQEGFEYGLTLINILRRLRKNPALVNKINEAQAVDIYNDLTFLKQPWYFFPELKGESLTTPEDQLARHTFDHFIYADNEFSSFVITKDQKYLKRLIATLYQQPFDKELVPALADKVKAKDWELQLVFFTYANVREAVMKRCKALLPPAGKADGDEQRRPTGAMWLKLKHRLAETPAFQGYDAAGKSNMYATLDYLEDLAQQKRDAKP